MLRRRERGDAPRGTRGDAPAEGDRALHHSVARDNALPLIKVLVDVGANPSLPAPRWDGQSAAAVAARAGRADALELSNSVLALAERALTEVSEWTPHQSREILDALQGA